MQQDVYVTVALENYVVFGSAVLVAQQHTLEAALRSGCVDSAYKT